MANQQVYILIENIGLSPAHRNALIIAFKSLGSNQSTRPPEINHWRARLDNDAVIFQASFNELNISIDALKGYLSVIYGVDVSDITHSTVPVVYSTESTDIVTFTYASIDRLRMAIFGYSGAWPTWYQSKYEVQGFLVLNSLEWGDIDG